MKIDIVRDSGGINIVNAYSEGSVVIGNITYSASLILSANDIIDDWPPQNLPQLTSRHLERVIALSPEIILLGTGTRLLFPDHDVLLPIISNRIGYEIMDTGAACRSYNFLVSEGRNVVAALFMIE